MHHISAYLIGIVINADFDPLRVSHLGLDGRHHDQVTAKRVHQLLMSRKGVFSANLFPLKNVHRLRFGHNELTAVINGRAIEVAPSRSIEEKTWEILFKNMKRHNRVHRDHVQNGPPQLVILRGLEVMQSRHRMRTLLGDLLRFDLFEQCTVFQVHIKHQHHSIGTAHGNLGARRGGSQCRDW